MKKWLLGGAVVIASSLLGGCYVSPDYGYVRGGGYGGDAYYGRSTTVYDDGYYAPGYYSPDYYGGYAYPGGVSIGVGTTWYGGSGDRYRHRDYDDRRPGGERHDYRGDGRHAGSWNGGAHEDRRGWSGRGGNGGGREVRRDDHGSGGSTGGDGRRDGRRRDHDHR